MNTIALSLEQIRGAVSEAATRAEEIFQEADGQARDAERMVSSVAEIAKVATNNAGAVEEVSGVATVQSSATADMVASSRELAALAEALRGVLQRFRTVAPDDGFAEEVHP